MRRIDICMICDDNYIDASCVAIYSMSETAKEASYCVHIIDLGLSEHSKARLKEQESVSLLIEFVEVDETELFCDEINLILQKDKYKHTFLKMYFADIFASLDRILYVDSDIVVRADLNQLFDMDLKNCQIAAVCEIGMAKDAEQNASIYEPYFNDGVVLFDLKHNDPKVLERKCLNFIHDNGELTEQELFNGIYHDDCTLLPVRYNFMATVLEQRDEKWTVEDINKLFGTAYSHKKELLEDACILHYASSYKPWNREDDMRVAYNEIWLSLYNKIYKKNNDCISDEEEQYNCLLSVVVPCYNVEKYVAQTLDGLVNQTFQDMEIICINDGSQDGTEDILRAYADKYDYIRVITDSNHGLGYQREQGLALSNGKYIYYMDSDDYLLENCFEDIVNQMEVNHLDVAFFEGDSFYETEELESAFPQYKELYHRKNWYPRIYNGKEFFVKSKKNDRFVVSAVLQMTRRKFIMEHGIDFLGMRMFEDNLYTIKEVLYAERVKVIQTSYFRRRVRGDSIITKDNQLKRIVALYDVMDLLLDIGDKHLDDCAVYESVVKQTEIYANMIFDAYENGHKDDIEEQLNREQTFLIRLIRYDRTRCRILGKKFENNNLLLKEKLQRTYDEKSELGRKLQQTYDEKSELNRKLQQTYDEKSELGRKLQQTYDEKSELGRKLQETYDEKYERGLEIKRLKQKKVQQREKISAQRKKIDSQIDLIKEQKRRILQLEKEQKRLVQKYETSTTMKVGRIVLFIPKMMKKIVKKLVGK